MVLLSFVNLSIQKGPVEFILCSCQSWRTNLPPKHSSKCCFSLEDTCLPVNQLKVTEKQSVQVHNYGRASSFRPTVYFQWSQTTCCPEITAAGKKKNRKPLKLLFVVFLFFFLPSLFVSFLEALKARGLRLRCNYLESHRPPCSKLLTACLFFSIPLLPPPSSDLHTHRHHGSWSSPRPPPPLHTPDL